MRGPRDSENEQRPKSFLVSPSISRARADKLRTHNITWIKATAEEFARAVLGQLQVEATAGIARLGHAEAAASGDERNIAEVSSALLDRQRPSAFLLGAEPTWSDIRTGRAVERDEDRTRFAKIETFLRTPRAKGHRIPTVVIRATAGAGKTTLLMKIASQLHSDGVRVGWIGTNAEVSPAVITRYCRGSGHPPVLVIDDAGRYGGQLGPLLRDISKSDDLHLVVICLRSHQHHLIDVPDIDALDLHEYGIGRLTDGDINRLLGVLEKERKLGALRALSAAERYSAFRDRADRQILVAMIEATSGARFEEKIIAEWADQDDTARYIYAVVAVATMMGYAMSSAEVLLACNRAGGRELEALARLQRAELLREDVDKRLRLRHRVIAEKLVDELTGRGTQVEHVIVGLCRALAIGAGTEERGARRRRRVLARVLSHDFLLRLMNDIEPARSAYAQLEDYLEKDHHFWLQRGCLELEAGELSFARNHLEYAAALGPTDPLVDTAFAHMQLRTAISNPSAPGAASTVETALETLRRVIAARGKTDYKPAHVFGSQVVGWLHRASLTPRARRDLLSEAKEVVEAALRIHRARKELRRLFDDLRKEQLRPQ
jgi:hypothetical protein